MLWFFLALSAAFFDGAYFILLKKYVKNVELHTLAALVGLVSFLISGILVFSEGVPEIGREFFPFLILTGVLEILAVFLYFRALEIEDLSLTMPMLSFTPAILLLSSFLILGEVATSIGILGILLVVAGSYTLNIGSLKDGFTQPIKKLFENRGVQLMLGVTLIWGVETNFIKILVLSSDIYFTTMALSLFIGLGFLIISISRREFNIGSLKNDFAGIFLLGLIVTGSAVTTNRAFELQIVPYVLSVKRLAVLFTVLYGALILGEEDRNRRIIGTLFMVGGSIIILFSG